MAQNIQSALVSSLVQPVNGEIHPETEEPGPNITALNKAFSTANCYQEQFTFKKQFSHGKMILLSPSSGNVLSNLFMEGTVGRVLKSKKVEKQEKIRPTGAGIPTHSWLRMSVTLPTAHLNTLSKDPVLMKHACSHSRATRGGLSTPRCRLTRWGRGSGSGWPL